MAYKSKNLSGSRRKATTAMVNQQDKLFAAQNSLKTFQRENKELTELTKNISDNTQGSVFLAQFLKNRSEDRAIARTQYDNWKEKFDATVSKNKYTDTFFPEYDDWYKNSTKAPINGKLISRSDMSYDHDPDRMNMLMKIMMEQNDGK